MFNYFMAQVIFNKYAEIFNLRTLILSVVEIFNYANILLARQQLNEKYFFALKNFLSRNCICRKNKFLVDRQN